MIKIKLSELEGLSEEEIGKKMEPMIDASFASPNGSLRIIQERVESFELLHGMKSEEMLRGIEYGDLEEEEDFAEWALDYSLLQDLLAYSANAKSSFPSNTDWPPE